MKSRMIEPNVKPLRSLGDDELAEVSGACHRRRHHRHGHGHGYGHSSAMQPRDGEEGLLAMLLSFLQHGSTGTIFQIVTGNTGPVNAVAGMAQTSVSVPE